MSKQTKKELEKQIELLEKETLRFKENCDAVEQQQRSIVVICESWVNILLSFYCFKII